MKLLFICTHNRCRSILAEAIARDVMAQHKTDWQVRSAGSHPAGVVYPGTLNFLQQQGISTQGLQSQSWDEFQSYFDDPDGAPVIAITVCDSAAGETCPVWFGKGIRAHWGLPDPSKLDDSTQQAQLFTQVAATLRKRITALLTAEPQNDAELRQLLGDLSAVE